jgi:hypothetical protein
MFCLIHHHQPINFPTAEAQTYVHTYIPHTLEEVQRHIRYSSETFSKTWAFYQNDLTMRNAADATGGKPIAVCLRWECCGTGLPYRLRIRKTGYNPPRGPSADWWVLTTAARNSLTWHEKHVGAQNNTYTLRYPSDDLRFGERSQKLSNVGQSLDGWPKIYYLELLRASEGTLSRLCRLHLQPLAATNLHWARVLGCGPFSLCVIYKEGLCPSSGDINRLMRMMMYLQAIKW